ncbi:hypothetical protein DVH24_017812 [Malus domestica]|uniref:KIB1-4 beta-propeller domain-containing protein n=1 Tax=Malus domestica TaxID=3750 RepID=A0A498KBQ9_MALDO|nr:hypothetical protein DVH24_017812 [Malus domestica]
MSECTVAAFFSSKEIGVCRPGKNSWSFSPMSDNSNDSLLCLLFSSCGILYALIDNNAKSGRVITRTLRFGDGNDLELKLVYDIKGKQREYYSTGLNIHNGFRYVYIKHKSYLIESTTNNELLLIHQFTDFRKKNDLGRETMTRDFVVYKLNEEDGQSFIEIQSLGNQILFLTSRGCSFSLPVSNSKGLEANCIYFLEMGVGSCMSEFSHPFYLNGRKFGKSRDDYSHAPPKRYWWGLSWFLPMDWLGFSFCDRIKSDWNTDLVTRDFLVYKIDPKDCGSFTEIQSLGNQILFVTSRGCSFSFPPSSFKGLEANCIYFVELGVGSCFGSSFAGRSGSNMCDFSHPFYLDGWKFGKSRKCYHHASPKAYMGTELVLSKFMIA